MISRKSTISRVGTGAVILALALAGCSSSSTSAAKGSGTANGSGAVAQSGGGPDLQVYRGASGQFVKNFNPLSPTSIQDVSGMIYESLFFFNNSAPLGTPPVPVLGKSYQLDKSGKVMTVELQPGVKWSDGQPFTAKDVAYTFNLMRKTPSLDRSNTPAGKATSDTSVTLTFDTPAFADAPNALGQPIVPEHIFSKMTDVAKDPNLNPVGTGPMMLSSFTAQSYLFKKSPTFRAAAQVAPPGIRYFSLSGNGAATTQLLAGDLDWTNLFIPDVDNVFKPHPNLHTQTVVTQPTVLATCSNPKLGCTGPQTDPVVRQAVAVAINRDQIKQLAYYGRGVASSPTFMLPVRDKQFIDPQFQPYSMEPDTAKAKSLLESDGWALGPDGVYAKAGQRLSMSVIVTAGYTDYVASLDIIKASLAKAGIAIDVQQKANPEVISALGLGKFQLAINGMGQGPTGDPYYLYNNNYTTSNTSAVGTQQNPYGNVAKFSNPAVDAAILAAGATLDPAVKAEQYKKIQAIIVPNLPYIPILNNVTFGEYSDANYTGWKLYNGGVEQTLLGLKAK